MSDAESASLSAGHPTYQLVRLIALRGSNSSGWCVFLEPTNVGTFEETFKDELRIQLQTELRIIDASKFNVSRLLDSLRNPQHDVVLVKGLDQWDTEEIKALDTNRSGLARAGFVIIFLSLRGLSRLLVHAPNLLSWVGGNIFRPEADVGEMSESDRTTRLRELSEHYGLTDEQVVEKAESGTLPIDPEFAEWLVLVGRGDLAG